MSGYSEASRQAFKRVDVTGGQRKIIDFLRARPRLRPTRQEIANLSGMKLQTVCARVNELLYDFNPPMLKELPVRDGAHPIELIEHNDFSTRGDSNGIRNSGAGLREHGTQSTGRDERECADSAAAAANQRAGRGAGGGNSGGVSGVRPAGEPVEPGAAPSGRQAVRAMRSAAAHVQAGGSIAEHGGQDEFTAQHHQSNAATARNLGPVTPYIPGRWSMSLEAAKQIAKDSGNAFIEEARKVIQTGAYWVR